MPKIDPAGKGGLAGDPQLLAAFRAGDRIALECVYRAHVCSIERYALALARSIGQDQRASANNVADLVQDVFIRAFSQEARLRYDGVHDYGRYLAAIARNCFVDTLRARSREILIDPRELPQDPDGVPEPDDCYDARTLAVLDAYVRGLPDGLRRVYEQRFTLERSQEQAAAVLGISRKVVRLAEKQLRTGLRRALLQAGIQLQPRAETAQAPANAARFWIAGNRGRI